MEPPLTESRLGMLEVLLIPTFSVTTISLEILHNDLQRLTARPPWPVWINCYFSTICNALSLRQYVRLYIFSKAVLELEKNGKELFCFDYC